MGTTRRDRRSEASAQDENRSHPTGVNHQISMAEPTSTIATPRVAQPLLAVLLVLNSCSNANGLTMPPNFYRTTSVRHRSSATNRSRRGMDRSAPLERTLTTRRKRRIGCHPNRREGSAFVSSLFEASAVPSNAKNVGGRGTARRARSSSPRNRCANMKLRERISRFAHTDAPLPPTRPPIAIRAARVLYSRRAACGVRAILCATSATME